MRILVHLNANVTQLVTLVRGRSGSMPASTKGLKLKRNSNGTCGTAELTNVVWTKVLLRDIAVPHRMTLQAYHVAVILITHGIGYMGATKTKTMASNTVSYHNARTSDLLGLTIKVSTRCALEANIAIFVLPGETGIIYMKN